MRYFSLQFFEFIAANEVFHKHNSYPVEKSIFESTSLSTDVLNFSSTVELTK